MRKVHAAFVDEFKGILIESVSDQTIDALAKGKQPGSVTGAVKKAATDLARQAAGV